MDDSRHPDKDDIAIRLGLRSAPSEAGERVFDVFQHPVKLAGALVIAALMLFALWRAFQPGPVQFVTANVEQGGVVVRVSATGTLKPLNAVDVGAEVSGRITEVFVDFNDEVSEGQVLALIDTAELDARVVEGEASLTSAKAALAQAEATVKEARAKRDRATALARTGTMSAQELDIADATLARAEANVAQSEAQILISDAHLNIARTNLARAHIRAPIDGIVLDRQVEPGQTVAATFQTPILFTVAEDLKVMRLHVDVDEADISVVHDGQTAVFTVDAYPDRSFDAEVLSVRNAPHTEEGVVTYEAVLDVDNSALELKPGMTATAEIVVEEVSRSLTVPNGALRFTPPGVDQTDKAPASGRVVWRLVGGDPEAVPVKTGPSDGLRTVIEDGALVAGEKVLVDIVRPETKKLSAGPRP